MRAPGGWRIWGSVFSIFSIFVNFFNFFKSFSTVDFLKKQVVFYVFLKKRLPKRAFEGNADSVFHRKNNMKQSFLSCSDYERIKKTLISHCFLQQKQALAWFSESCFGDRFFLNHREPFFLEIYSWKAFEKMQKNGKTLPQISPGEGSCPHKESIWRTPHVRNQYVRAPPT